MMISLLIVLLLSCITVFMTVRGSPEICEEAPPTVLKDTTTTITVNDILKPNGKSLYLKPLFCSISESTCPFLDDLGNNFVTGEVAHG